MSAHTAQTTAPDPACMRIDKWLWAARFFKTRALAVQAIHKGRVQVNGQPCKPARDVRVGDTIAVRPALLPRTVVVRALSAQRGGAPVAQQLYTETEQSMALREELAEHYRLAPEPARTITQGRPTKRDRRQLQQTRDSGATGGWDARWSARLPER